MGTPYLRRGIRLGDPVVTTTGAIYVTDTLYYNDLLATDGDWLERTGATAFTGAYYHTALLTYAYSTELSGTLRDSGLITDFPSGDRYGDRRHYPRSIRTYRLQYLTPDEFYKYRLFYQLSRGEVIELVDEDSNTNPCRWIGDFSYSKSPGRSVAQPFELSITLEMEHVSKTYSVESGGLI